MSVAFHLLFSLSILCCNQAEDLSKRKPTQENLQLFLQQASLNNGNLIPHGIQTPIETQYGTWQLSLQYFAEKETLYVAINDYIWLDSSVTTQSTVFTMTQMLTQNHAMVGGKFQLNPTSGAITIGTEFDLLDDFNPEQLKKTVDQLVRLALDNYPMLTAATGDHHY